MSENEPICCSFCGVEKSADVPLISGNEGRICEACVKLAHQVVGTWGNTKRKVELSPQLRTPLAIKSHLDDYVIGQENAKETLAIAVFNHYLRLLNSGGNLELGEDGGAVELEKSNVLMAGPSGTGKTLIVKSLARIIGVPFVSADATTLTQAGYVGDDVDSIVSRLLEASDGDVSQAEWGIIYIDEIDKISRRGGGATSTRDVSGEGVQQALLKLVEGSEISIAKSQRKEGSEKVKVDTRNILFIVGGAFPGLEELIERRIVPKESSIGFHSPVQKEKPSVNTLLENLLPDDLQSFGLIPEFIGRFPITTFLRELDVDALIRILTEPKNALVKQYRQLFAYQGVGLDVTDQAIRFIAEQAVERNTGARGLRSVLESALHQTMFDMPSTLGLRNCTLGVCNKGDKTVLEVKRDLDPHDVGMDLSESVEKIADANI